MVIKKGRKYEHFKSKKAYKKYEAYIKYHINIGKRLLLKAKNIR